MSLRLPRKALAFVFLWCAIFPADPVRSQELPERTRENFMVVLRETMDAARVEDAFTPTGTLTADRGNGEEVELELAYWEFIGDTQVRFVFDGPEVTVAATPEDLERLGLERMEDALGLALANVKSVYGEPSAIPWKDGVQRVQGASPDFDSSFFLDRAFWLRLLEDHPEGVVVAVPTRGDLLYAPRSDARAVDRLGRAAADLYSGDDRLRVSSFLYVFDQDGWSLFGKVAGSAVPAASQDPPGEPDKGEARPEETEGAPASPIAEAGLQDAFNEIAAATRRGDWAAFARMMHPDALSEFHSTIAALLEMDPSGQAAHRLFGIESSATMSELSSEALFAQFMASLVRANPLVKELLGSSSAVILGTVREGDVTHVVHRSSMDLEGSTVSVVDIASFKRHGDGWLGLLSGETQQVIQILKGKMREADPSDP